jgi:hypothetical protein
MTDTQIDITDIDKVKLLEALWHKQKPAAFFTFNLVPPPSFDEKGAKQAVTKYIDYFCGRCIKTNLSGDTVDPFLFDRDAGEGAFQSMVDQLAKDVAPKDIVINI